ncbi:MFS transporter [Brachybacterium squillarum]|uniref:MFS transporter n=1 Tax=Brachybacterium squillarum TaxID=661979 RepID=UPI002221490C|nr:MFS transporter [Brachybacterium squillarum]MCW1805133.1 MFS transporter [Brachybacterium squillarum]
MDLDLLTRARLSTMMFLEFFVWGAWFVTLGTYLATDLQASGSQISLAFLTQSLGAILAPFIVGLIADRFFAAQRILGVLHLVSAVMLFLAGRQEEFGPFFVLALLAMVSFMPTLALANSISFRRLASPEKQFPSIRVFGTIGWIIAGLLIGWLGWEAARSRTPSSWPRSARRCWACTRSRSRTRRRSPPRAARPCGTCWASTPSPC